MGTYNAMALVDVLTLSLGVGIMFVSLLSWERSGMRWLRDLALVTVGATAYLILDLLRFYEIASGWPPAAGGRALLAGFSATGNLVLAYAIPAFAHNVTSLATSRIQRVAQHVGAAVFALAGVLDESCDLPGFHVFNDLMLAGLLTATAVLLAIGYRRIVESETRAMVRRLLWLSIASVILSRGQLLLTSILGVPLELRRVRVVAVFYYLGVLTVMLVYAVRHLFRPSDTVEPQLSPEFVSLHGISRREGEIIAMLVQGYPNRVIGERLYISDRTVKNHVSSIYRKTGAANKVQLLNMIRNTPGARAAAAASTDGRPNDASSAPR